MGRPSLYSAEMGETLCGRLMDGESLSAICREEDMPSQRAVYLWLTKHAEFVQQYAQAREVQAHQYADETRDIVDTELDPARARIRFDQRRWHAGKLLPKVYGDKLQHTGDGGGAIAVRVTIDDAGSEDPSTGTAPAVGSA